MALANTPKISELDLQGNGSITEKGKTYLERLFYFQLEISRLEHCEKALQYAILLSDVKWPDIKPSISSITSPTINKNSTENQSSSSINPQIAETVNDVSSPALTVTSTSVENLEMREQAQSEVDHANAKSAIKNLYQKYSSPVSFLPFDLGFLIHRYLYLF